MGDLRVGVIGQMIRMPSAVAKLDPRIQYVVLLALVVAAAVGVATRQLVGRARQESPLPSQPETIQRIDHSKVMDNADEIGLLLDAILQGKEQGGQHFLEAVSRFYETYKGLENECFTGFDAVRRYEKTGRKHLHLDLQEDSASRAEQEHKRQDTIANLQGLVCEGYDLSSELSEELMQAQSDKQT